MDSQLLATGSLVTRDLLRSVSDNKWGRETVIVSLSVLGLMLSLWSDLSILDLGLLAFSMYAVMFPSVFLVANWDSVDGRAVISSIIAGEAIVILAVFSPESFDGWGIRPEGAAMPTVVIPSILAAIGALVAAQWHFNRVPGFFESMEIKWGILIPVIPFVVIFMLAQDFWWWDNADNFAWGLPIWIWWSAALSLVQTAIMARIVQLDSLE